MKKMIMKRSTNTITLGVVIALIIMALFFLMDNDSYHYIFAPSYENMSAEQRESKVLSYDDYFYAKDLVKLDFYSVIDWFAEDDDGRYYAVPYGEEEYAMVYVDNAYVPYFEEASDALYEYIYDESGTMSYPVFKKGRHARVAVYRADDELRGWYSEMFDTIGITDYKEHTDPYVFYYQPQQEWDNPYIKLAIFGSIAAVVLIVFLIKGLLMPTKFYKKLNASGISEEELGEDIENAINVADNIFGNRYIIFSGNMNVYKAEDFVWAFIFTQNTQHKVYGIIPAGTTTAYSVRMFDKNGNFASANCGAKLDTAKKVEEIIRSKYSPDIFVGHSDEVARIYSENPAMFIENIRGRNINLSQISD